MKLNKAIQDFYLSLKKQPFKLLVALFVYLVIFNIWGPLATLFLGTAFLFAIMNWDSRVFIVFGLLFLISCPLYLLQRKELMAEEMAVYAYYSLFLGVMLQIIEYWRENNSFGWFSNFLHLSKKTKKQ